MGVRSGEQYLSNLSSREVYLEGELISDLTIFPGTETIARVYDLQFEPELTNDLTYFCDKIGENISTSSLIPLTSDDLKRRRKATETCSRATFGLMGRLPDFGNTLLMSFTAARDFFAQGKIDFSKNILDYYLSCQQNDLFIAHAAIDPLNVSDRLTIIKETDDGLIVQGVKKISTNVPLADELIVFSLRRLSSEEELNSLCFAIPVNTPGLRLFCRKPFHKNTSSKFDHPIGISFEEIEATCIFENVLIPWNRVFFYRNVEMNNTLYDATYARNYIGYQEIIRCLAKTQLLAGIAMAIAEITQKNSLLSIQEKLGELLGFLEIIKGAILLSEFESKTTCWGVLCPAIKPIFAMRYQFPKMNAYMIETIQYLGSGNLMSCPSEKDFSAKEIERYFKIENVSGCTWTKLLNLAWDLTGDAFGQRQLLYERFHAGDSSKVAAAQYIVYDDKQLLYKVVNDALNATI
jgi:aromatic ring hydroxylase